MQKKLRTIAIKCLWLCKKDIPKCAVLRKVIKNHAAQRNQYVIQKKTCIFQRLIHMMREM